jgi:hypothetical protein
MATVGRPHAPQRLPRAAPAPPAALASQSRAAELLIAAAAHRIKVEHWLTVEQQQTGQQLCMAEMVEGWMTEEDAIEVTRASWHERPSPRATCDLASHVHLHTEADEHVFEEAFAAAFELRGRAERPRPSPEAEPVASNSP